MTTTASRCCQAAELALKMGRARDALALCQHVLAQHRWHLQAHLRLGQAYLELENLAEAQGQFRLILEVDPECAEAHSGMAVIAQTQGDAAAAARQLARAFENAPESDEVRAALQQVLAQQAGRPVAPPAFTPACVGRFYLRRGLPQPAAEAYAAAHRTATDREDLRLAYATALWQSGVREQAADLCRPLLGHAPRPLVALLIAAASALLGDKRSEGQRLWNEARAWDPDDTRARELLGAVAGLPAAPDPAEVSTPQSPALAELLETAAALREPPVPATSDTANELAAYAKGIAGTRASAGTEPAPSDPALRRFQSTVEEIEQRLYGGSAPAPAAPAPRSHAGRRPAEVILAWEDGLRKHFGDDGLNLIAPALQDLAMAAERHGISSRVVYLDRSPYPELPAPDPRDPQQIKAFLDGLDRRLREDSQDLNYISLVGGDALIPLAPLTNPTEDTDEIVPSDNLYASRDPTYLIPERAVGRLLDEGPGRTAAFVEQLGRCSARRRGERRLEYSPGCLGGLASWLEGLLPLRQSKAPAARRFGLSAQVWAQASQAVFKLLPGQEPLHLCPPDCRDRIPSDWLASVPLAYFNLHGAADSPHWYGQRDLATPGGGPLMPIAFSPDKIPGARVDGTVVYSEACYGADTAGKDRNASIAQRFLAEGVLGVVGSTVISYGVSAPPLTDADLLGVLFWQALLGGQRLGDALLQAKVEFTREVYRRQGYLDGDDMKTLLEFVLYGDPLLALSAVPPQQAHAGVEEEVPIPPVLCGRHAKSVAVHQLSGDLVARVRRSLSWLQQGGEVSSMEVALRSGCAGGSCTGRCDGGKAAVQPGPEALVFSSHRDMRTEDGTMIPQWARVVVDQRGRIVKMAVTR